MMPSAETDLPLPERLALAQQVFRDHYGACFWSWAPDTVVTEALLPGIAHALRLNGGREHFLLSARLCPSTTYREKYLPRCAPTGTPTAT